MSLFKTLPKKALFPLLILALFLSFLLSPVDTDLGWHLRYGQEIWVNQRLFRQNDLGFFLPHYQWVHSYSLYQLLTYFLFKAFNFPGLIFSSALLLSTSFYLTLKSSSSSPWRLSIFTPLLFILGWPVFNLGWRSQLFSFLGVSLVYFLLLRKKSLSFSFLPLWFLLFFLWANLHGAFIFGLLLLSFYTLEQLFLKNTRQRNMLFLIIFTCFIATLLNPFGLKIYVEIFRHSWYPLNQLIAEWVPPNRHFFPLILALIIAPPLILLQKNEKPGKTLHQKNFIFLTLSWLFFLTLSLKARRHLPFLGLSSIYFLNQLLPISPVKTTTKLNQFSPLLISSGLLLFIFWKLLHLSSLSVSWNDLCQNPKTNFPCQAANYLDQNPSTCKNIFNTYEWGGYLAWQLPTRKTFIDGRMPAWPNSENQSPYTTFLEIIQARPAWDKRLENYQADCLLISSGTFLDLELSEHPHPNWTKIFADHHSVIWQKANPPSN